MPVKIFFCYAHEDEPLLNKLKTQLRPLQRQGLIDVWHDRDIRAGAKWEQEIGKHLNSADIILLLVSPDFMDSDYCYGTEMQQALERHERGESRVIPVILRPVYWKGALGSLQALPKDATPVLNQSWHSTDDAFFDVAESIRKVVEELTTQPAIPSPVVKPEEFSLLRALTRHSKLVYSVAFSPDGQTLASSSWGDSINLWNLSTGQVLRTLTGHSSGVTSVAFSPDGQTLASGSQDSTIKLWGKKST
ncbi:MAG: hypothetical protein NVS2B2_37560 [Ktedonobacteraceae bacterium]